MRARNEENPFGWTNPRRGMGVTNGVTTYTDHARALVSDFPVNTTVLTSTFDQWLEGQGLLTIPPVGTPKDDDAWIAHVQRRNQQRVQINLAACHPRMFQGGSVSFQIVPVKGIEAYRVYTPNDVDLLNLRLKKISSITLTQKKHLQYYFQGTNWESLPAYEKQHALFYLEYLEEIEEDFARRLGRHVNKAMRFLSACQSAAPANNSLPRITDQTHPPQPANAELEDEDEEEDIE